MDPFWIKFIYAPLAAGMAYVAYDATRTVAQAIKSGIASPNSRLPAVTKAGQPCAYWSFVISWCILVIPLSVVTTILFIGVVLGLTP